jgi:polyvinyl alcohol dehydrogenase (cytochrome)
MAAADGRVFVPISDSLTNSGEPARPGLAALDAATGKVLWWSPAPAPRCAWGPQECRGALSQAVTAIPGIVFSGSQDGHLRAHDARTGKVVWQLDTGVPFAAVNSTAAHGGSLDAGGPVVAEGVVYVNSGYGQFLGSGGNVLLAISVDGR